MHHIFEKGTLKHVSGESHTFEMRLLEDSDLEQMYKLRDDIENSISEWDILLPTPNEILHKGLGMKGMTCGTLVENKLVGLRSIHFPKRCDDGHIGLDACISNDELDTVVELKLSLVDHEYRRNNLQKRMTAHLMNAVKNHGSKINHCCAIVSPKNTASIADKFAVEMTLSKIMLKNNKYWRCLFTKDMRKPHTIPSNKSIYVNNRDFKQQSTLLSNGFHGYKLERTAANTSAILYAK